jgi:para-aminobenzoate synthetase/4-amino-4-deoxychorismate lyase
MPPTRVLLAGDSRFGPTGWWAFSHPIEVLLADSPHEVPAVLARVERAAVSEGLWGVGFVAYEASTGFEPRAVVHSRARGVPFAWFGLFPGPALVAPPLSAFGFTPPALEADLSPEAYVAAIEAIHAAIARGDTYQANFTYRLRGDFRGEPSDLFSHLAFGQRSAYSALLEHEDWAVASVSPELFFERLGRLVRCRPMKGTSRRGRTLGEDAELALELASSSKERAENVMIVDMVRNDLGRIAVPGSVRVAELFAVERYATVTQMTSSVEADIDAPLAELFRALFPCASITGAPKLRTMEILNGLEPSPRGLYTGALGFVAPGGDARFSVAIRTVWLDRFRGTVEYGTGSGIVWDSRPMAELAESRIKTRVLASPEPAFELLETILWQLGVGYVLLERHLARMAESADYFQMPFDPLAAAQLLATAATAFGRESQRIRLLLDRAGGLRITHTPAEPFRRRWRVALASKPVDASDRFLFHKTTCRDIYEGALAGAPDMDEVALWNSAGELTEGTRTNLALRLDGRLWTPPVECGLLAGCLRAEALARGKLAERVLLREDLARAEAVYLLSSVRGWIQATMTESRLSPGPR